MAETPERIYHVSQSYFSIIRHYGSCLLEGVRYIHEPATDSMVREDVLKKEQKALKALKKPKTSKKESPKLFDE